MDLKNLQKSEVRKCIRDSEKCSLSDVALYLEELSNKRGSFDEVDELATLYVNRADVSFNEALFLVTKIAVRENPRPHIQDTITHVFQRKDLKMLDAVSLAKTISYFIGDYVWDSIIERGDVKDYLASLEVDELFDLIIDNFVYKLYEYVFSLEKIKTYLINLSCNELDLLLSKKLKSFIAEVFEIIIDSNQKLNAHEWMILAKKFLAQQEEIFDHEISSILEKPSVIDYINNLPPKEALDLYNDLDSEEANDLILYRPDVVEYIKT